MKKILLLGTMLLLAALVLSGCKAPEPVTEEQPTATPVVTEAPTPNIPTVEPTITPRPMEGEVERPPADATPILIDPIDKPTRPPVVLGNYRLYESPGLNISFEVPEYWAGPEGEGTNTLTFSEPLNDIRSGRPVPSSVVISVSSLANVQTENDAKAALDAWLTDYRAEFQSLDTSSKAPNNMMGETGSYVTYWVDMPVEGSDQPEKMRGRCLIVPKDKRLYMVRYLCPVDYNSDYEAVFKKIRSTIKEL